jgi:hypothetical protein
MVRSIVLLILLFCSGTSSAFVSHGNVKIKEFVMWEGDSYALLILSNNAKCHMPLVDKQLYSFVLATYMAGRTVTMFCHDAGETINGYSDSHKLHRVNGV